jgi:hypothetical protein
MGYEYRAPIQFGKKIDLDNLATCLPKGVMIVSKSAVRAELSIARPGECDASVEIENDNVYLVFYSATKDQRNDIITSLESWLRDRAERFSEL